MNAASILLLAFAMSTDAFAAAVGKGSALLKPRWSEALRTGAIFGVIEAITPLVGWALGYAASDYWAAAGFDDTLLRWQMKPEVVNGEKKDIQSRVQTRGGQTGR